MGFDTAAPALWRAAPGAAARAQVTTLDPQRRARGAHRDVQPAWRYRIRSDERGRVLVCVEAPTLAVRVERGVCVSASDARHAPPGTIFLDGAAQGEPFADPVRAVYNLDHHEGCVRAFTLSACEQAMVLLLRGLDLRRREWTVVANDADLDAILAIWVLLNHHRLTGADGAARAEIMPLLRLEGAIDAHGLSHLELCALPPALLDETQRRMERLRDCERSLRATGRWQQIDLLDYVRERLEQIDALVYPQDAFSDLVEIEELGRAPLDQGSVAVACRARVGIYEIERQLGRFHGPRLGLLVLRQREGVYTLRQTDPALPASLEALYAHLNRIDPAVRADQTERRWGGSAEIGGSPRSGGTRLLLDEILAACRHVYARPPWTRRLGLAALACTLGIAVPGAAVLARDATGWPGAPSPAVCFGAVLSALAACCFALGARRTRGLHGWRLPAGFAWLASLPFALVGALAGGTWLPDAPSGTPLPDLLYAALLSALGTELLFRGFLQGRLTWCAAPRAPGGAALSGPVLATGILYAAVTVALAALGATQPGPLVAAAHPAISCGGALLFGLAAGTARERSGSLLPALALHGLGVLAALGTLLGALQAA
jgi:membrane protease YdiL (CAAX protease family)